MKTWQTILSLGLTLGLALPLLRLEANTLVTPVSGNVLSMEHQADGSVLVAVDYELTFDPTLIDRKSYTEEFTVNLGPDLFEAGEAFGIFTAGMGGTILDPGEMRGSKLSNPSPDLVFGTAGISPGQHVGLSDGLVSYELVPYLHPEGSSYPSGFTRSPVIDVSSFAVRLVTTNNSAPPEPVVPEPSGVTVVLTSLVLLTIRYLRNESRL